jgi:hypothetical protein
MPERSFTKKEIDLLLDLLDRVMDHLWGLSDDTCEDFVDEYKEIIKAKSNPDDLMLI